MNKLLPFLFPLLALIIVLVLLFRWWQIRNQGAISPEAQNVEVEELPLGSVSPTTSPTAVRDLPSITLEPATHSGELANGVVRYEVSNGKVSFTVQTNLPAPQAGKYQVWINKDQTLSKVAVLSETKGGYSASSSVEVSRLPLEVIVSREVTDDQQLETVLLRGRLQQ